MSDGLTRGDYAFSVLSGMAGSRGMVLSAACAMGGLSPNVAYYMVGSKKGPTLATMASIIGALGRAAPVTDKERAALAALMMPDDRFDKQGEPG